MARSSLHARVPRRQEKQWEMDGRSLKMQSRCYSSSSTSMHFRSCAKDEDDILVKVVV